MSRLEGGPSIVSSISRSCFRARSSPGAFRVLPAPAAVPVERLVGIGLVSPRTVRPVAGVWASSLSRPVPPRRLGAPAFALLFVPELRRGRAVFLEAPFRLTLRALRLAGRVGFFACFRRVFPRAVLAGAAFRLEPALRAFARAPARALRLEVVRFRPLLFAAFFFAINASGGVGRFDR